MNAEINVPTWVPFSESPLKYKGKTGAKRFVAAKNNNDAKESNTNGFVNSDTAFLDVTTSPEGQ
jgi:hypothetical protein